jgi:Bacterial Ig domain
MTKLLGLACLMSVMFAVEASAACSAQRAPTSRNQTVDTRMRVTSGDACGYRLRDSLSPVHTIAIAQRPSNGAATVDVNRVRYRSRPGFVGNDTFTYAMHGHSALSGSPAVWRVRVHVTVVPKSR